MSLTPREFLSVQLRILRDAKERLFIGPATAILSGTSAVFLVGATEGWAHCRSPPSWSFIIRYGTAQIIPSLIWARQPAELIATTMNLPLHRIFRDKEMPVLRTLLVTRTRALRGAIAGSVVLSQVVGLMGVGYSARKAYEDRCAAGREPPLHSSTDDDTNGVVIRMAGRESNVTALSMATAGRRHIFPIFEESHRPSVQELLRLHSVPRASQWSAIQQRLPWVPIYWQVDNGRYSSADSWDGMYIPRNWIFTTKEGGKLLVLEADATTGEHSSLSLCRTKDCNDLDLDLNEVAQGFYRLKSLILGGVPNDLKVLRVLLVDSDSKIVSGGGRVSSIRQHVTELDLADIIIDARAPLLHAISSWLEQVAPKKKNGSLVRMLSNEHTPIILETPHQEWFLSIQTELAAKGYKVMDRSEAASRFGTTAVDLPMLVYETSSPDTIHTIRQFIAAGIVSPNKVCAMLTDFEGLESAESELPRVASICSSQVYDRLLRWARQRAIEGEEWEKIQRDLDQGLAWDKACENTD